MHLAGKRLWREAPESTRPEVVARGAREVTPFLDETRRGLLASELEFQARHRTLDLPRGPVHADLSATTCCSKEITSRSDRFLFRRDQTRCLFDLAVTVNDWCVDREAKSTLRARPALGRTAGREFTGSNWKPGR